MALFFLAAGLVFILARWFGPRTKHEGTFNPEGKIKPEKETASLWPPLMALGLILLLALMFAIYNGLMLAQLTMSRDEIPWVIRALSWFRDHQASELIGGALAGLILYEGFRRSQEMGGGTDGAVKNSAVVILPAALFLAVALLSREEVLERIAGVEAGGVKVTMQPMDGASRRDEIGLARPTIVGSGAISSDSFPNLTLLNDLIKSDENTDLIARDLAIIRRFRGKLDSESEKVIKEYRLLLRLFGRNLECLSQYVSMSNDGRLIAISGVDVPLGLLFLERSLRGRAPSAPEDKEGAKKLLRQILLRFEQFRGEMNNYVRVARPESPSFAVSTSTKQPPDWNKCSDDRYDQLVLVQVSEILEALWVRERNAPYLTLAAAWLGSAYKDQNLAAKLLMDWLVQNPSDGASDIVLAWFRVRTLIQLVNILPSAFGGPESATARHVLEATLREFEAMPGLPTLERYAQSSVRGDVKNCPKIGDIHDEVDTSLYNTRIFLLARTLHAIVDNPDPTNRLNAQHMQRATALRDADPVCIKKMAQNQNIETRRALAAIHQIVYARVALAWSSDATVSREQAQELKKQGREALRKGLNELEALYAEWRHKPLYENGRRLTDLEKHLQRGFDYFPDLERARWLAQEFLR